MRKLGLNRLLQLVVLLPLLAMVAFGAVLVLQTLNSYREVERLAALEQLVNGASRLTISALNLESTAAQAFVASGSEAKRVEMDTARRRSDDAIRLFKESAASARLSDPKAVGLINDIEQRLGGLNAVRAKADARTLQRSDLGALLQPITAGLADLFLRLARLINQDQLSQMLLGMQAVMQMNDGQRIEAARSDAAISSGPLDPETYRTLLLGLSKQSIFGQQFDNLGPARVNDQLQAFTAGPHGRAIEALRPAILAINHGGKVSEADVKRWREAMTARNAVWSAAVETTLEELTATMEKLRWSARWQLVLYVGACLLALIVVMAMNRVVLKVVRGLLGALSTPVRLLGGPLGTFLLLLNRKLCPGACRRLRKER